MALGLVENTEKSRKVVVRLAEGVGAAGQARPTGASDATSVAMSKITAVFNPDEDQAAIAVYNTAGSGAVSVPYVRLWGRFDYLVGVVAADEEWFPTGTGTDADKGKINKAAAMGETSTDLVRHAEMLNGALLFDRVGVEVGAVAGTGPAVNVDLIILKGARKR